MQQQHFSSAMDATFSSCEVSHRHLILIFRKHHCSREDDTKAFLTIGYIAGKLILGQHYKEQNFPFVTVVWLLSSPFLLLLRLSGRRTVCVQHLVPWTSRNLKRHANTFTGKILIYLCGISQEITYRNTAFSNVLCVSNSVQALSLVLKDIADPILKA